MKTDNVFGHENKKKTYLFYLKRNSFVERLETFKHKFGEKTTDKVLRHEKTKLT